MKWREFIALITSAGAWPLDRQAQRKLATSSRWAKADRACRDEDQQKTEGNTFRRT
jgi:hypothetical protein